MSYVTPFFSGGHDRRPRGSDGQTGRRWRVQQYATDSVEKIPYEKPDGKVVYDESIVQKLPPIPKRKDRV